MLRADLLCKLSNLQSKASKALISLLSNSCALLQFDPTLHIAYEAPSRSYTLTELGLDPSDRKNKSNAVAVKDFAYTEPFRLLSAAGVEARIIALSQSLF